MDTEVTKNKTNDLDSTPESLDSTENQKKKLRYPRSIPFIIGNEFCERFNYYGMRTILVLYLNQILDYSKNDATVIFHIFTMFVYFLCIFGAIIADSWLGKFKTILYLSIVYVSGSVLISVGAIESLNLPGVELTMIGLALIAIGSGGIKPCVAAFGGDQFKLPEQVKQMATFFSLFYFSINSGSLISTTVTPILREDVHCFGKPDCYSLAFGVPAVLMCISVVIFVIGRPMYNSKPPAGNMVLLVTKTIGHAIITKIKECKKNVKEHWLDYAEDKYDRKLIDDVKVLLRVLLLYIPLPIFWALFDQQGSRWTFQAQRMDGVLGTIDIKPDQMQLINPLLILVFIPLYEAFFYPLLAKIGISRPLQKLFCGGILAGVAFTLSGIVELELEKTYPVLPQSGYSELRIFNGIPNCQYSFETDIPNNVEIELNGLEQFKASNINLKNGKKFNWQLTTNSSDCPMPESTIGEIILQSEKAISYFITINNGNFDFVNYIDYTDKPEKGSPEIRILANIQNRENIILRDANNNAIRYDKNYKYNSKADIPSSKYDLYVDKDKIKSGLEIKQGGVYTILIGGKDDKFNIKLIQVTAPNSLHILWLVPQYFIMTLGEVMFSVTGLEFSYSQAPASMKSVLQACWLLTVAIGNAIVVIIAEAKIFDSQAYEFFLFAGLMFVDMLFFSWLAYRYKPNNPNHSESGDTDETVSVKADISNNEAKKIEE